MTIMEDNTVNEVPFPRSYWVRPGKLLAGCYPGAPGPREATRKLKGLLDAGIRGFISLMEPNETDHQGREFSSYQDAKSQVLEILHHQAWYPEIRLTERVR